MLRSTEQILTTHVGSLPRPQEVVDALFTQDHGEPYDQAAFDATMRRAVDDVVAQQRAAGVDIVSDGEMSKISYATYIRHRLSGFAIGEAPRATPKDLDDLPLVLRIGCRGWARRQNTIAQSARPGRVQRPQLAPCRYRSLACRSRAPWCSRKRS